MRGNALSMTMRKGYTATVDAICDAWNGLTKDAERIVSITARTWAQVGVKAVAATLWPSVVPARPGVN